MLWLELLGHKAVVPARHGRHGTQEVGADELKPLCDLSLAPPVANWLLGALVGSADVVRGQRDGEIDFRLGDVPRGLPGALVRMSQALVLDVRPPLPP